MKGGQTCKNLKFVWIKMISRYVNTSFDGRNFKWIWYLFKHNKVTKINVIDIIINIKIL